MREAARSLPVSLPVPKSGMQSEMNVTPFLDVLLVLLIIFMYLCLNQQKAIMAQLPDPAPAPPTPAAVIVLEVRPNASYAINTEPVQGAQLGVRLHAIYASRPEKTIIVRGTAGVKYQDVVTAMDIAKGAGVVAIGLTGRK
ncbi:MAG TPA: biopolymer transporter ExbD [Gemmatimonadaceae bacterium]|nr:biopolymer transporter ExbD [Gemmatimonadaceae bacterium]